MTALQPDSPAAAVNLFLDAVYRAADGRPFYIQVGANDGVMADPVHRIAKADPWAGLLIEPHPAYFRRLADHYRGRAGMRLANVGISDAEGTLPLYHVAEEAMPLFPRWLRGCASFSRDQLVFSLRLACRKRGIAFDEKHVAVTEVPVRRLDGLLAEQGIARADLMVIDVEGHELAVMRSLDLAALGLRGMLVECTDTNRAAQPAYVAALAAAGFSVYELGEDLCAFDPARLGIDLGAIYDKAGYRCLARQTLGEPTC